MCDLENVSKSVSKTTLFSAGSVYSQVFFLGLQSVNMAYQQEFAQLTRAPGQPREM